jgi:hypothetical protein
VSRYRSCTWKPLANRSTRALQKDILCWHTMVSTSMAGTWGYFNTGAGGRGVYSHGLLGGGWGPDLRDGLDGVCWQAQDTDLRAASNLDGNWHVIAFETADNAARPIQPWTPKQCAKIVEVCVEANQVDGIPLLIIPDSKVGRRGVGYHRLGCDPYRVAFGELWTSVYGKDCPTDARIRQLPALVDQARIVVRGRQPPDRLRCLGGVHGSVRERSRLRGRFVYLVVTVGLAAAGAWWRGRQAPHQYRLRPHEQAGKPSGAPYVSGANGGGGFDAGGVVPKAGGHRGGRLPPSGTPG